MAKFNLLVDNYQKLLEHNLLNYLVEEQAVSIDISFVETLSFSRINDDATATIVINAPGFEAFFFRVTYLNVVNSTKVETFQRVHQGVKNYER